MTTLTSSTVFTIGAGATVSEDAAITILPAAGAGTGKGRLIHPTLGTYDYAHAPDQWTNLDGDVIIAPIWASSKTLQGASNTLWQGDIRDTIVEERWTGQLSASMAHLRALLAHWQNPPDPEVGYVEWYPQYATALGFKVVLLSVEVGGQGVNLDYVSRQNWATGAIALKMRIVERV